MKSVAIHNTYLVIKSRRTIDVAAVKWQLVEHVWYYRRTGNFHKYHVKIVKFHDLFEGHALDYTNSC